MASQSLPRAGNKLRGRLCGCWQLGELLGLEEDGAEGGANPVLTTHPKTSVHTCSIQRQPQLMGVHGARGVLVELVEYCLGGEEQVSPPPGS